MLAKVWKKLLLAICIIACLFNVTAKLVNRHSLEDNIKTANDGETVFDFSKTEKEEETIVATNSVEDNTVSDAEVLEENAENTVEYENVETEANTSESNEFDALNIYDSISSFFKFDNLF